MSRYLSRFIEQNLPLMGERGMISFRDNVNERKFTCLVSERWVVLLVISSDRPKIDACTVSELPC